MPRVVSKAYVQALEDSPERPPLDLHEEAEADFDELIASNEETTRAVSELTSKIGSLGELLKRKPETSDALIVALLTKISVALNNLKPRPVKQWDFDIVRHPNGDMEKIKARAID